MPPPHAVWMIYCFEREGPEIPPVLVYGPCRACDQSLIGQVSGEVKCISLPGVTFDLWGIQESVREQLD